MKLVLNAGDMAVLTGALASHAGCIYREMDRPDIPEKHREMMRESIQHINVILDMCATVVRRELES